jgi:hypothetical protein
VDGFKYALMAFRSGGRSEPRIELAPKLWTFPGDVGELFEKAEIAHWRGWVGTLNWRNLEDADQLVMVCGPSKTAEVLDGENESMLARLGRARSARLLTGPNGFNWGESWLLTGEARGAGPADGVKTIRSFGSGKTIVRPFYSSPGREEFWRLQPRMGRGDGWLDRWREAALLLEPDLPRLLSFGLLAFEHAFDDFEIEFKIPNCVRATESIVALGAKPPHAGRAVFAERVLKLCPMIATDPYVGGGDIRERLVSLYELRIECVHGKIPFDTLPGTPEEREEEAAKLDYLAEFVAREALLVALRAPNMREVFTNREALELAWVEGRFPPPLLP